jgi:hypothetical protein
VARLALLGRVGATLGAGARQKYPQRHFRRSLGDCSAFADLGLGEGIAGATVFNGMIDGFSHEAGAHDEQQRTEHCAHDLV